MPTMRRAKRGEKCPPGYTTKYMWSDSDYRESKDRYFVKKKKASAKKGNTKKK